MTAYQLAIADVRREEGCSWPCATYQHARCKGQVSSTGGRPLRDDPECTCECHDE